MQYVSTRGLAPEVLSRKAILKGMAEDGGLYVPAIFPSLDPHPFPGGDGGYACRAAWILGAFLADYTAAELAAACRAAYGRNFDSRATVPLKILEEETAVLELWHGPTLAFKDLALQLMPHLLSLALWEERDGLEIAILVATSGDTGKAALEGFADVPGVRIFVFYPHEGVSEIQRLQMTTQRGGNVGVCAVRGNFDDAQNGVKEIFAEVELNRRLAAGRFRLSSANSINWGRLAPQIVYYFTAYADLAQSGRIRRGQAVNVCVPTGNFGNILAAYYAARCGLPLGRLICASNRNRVLTDFMRTGIYDRRREFHRTESPSMDILISSNLERLLFELAGRDPEAVREWMEQLAHRGWYGLGREALDHLQSLFYGGSAGREETREAICQVFEGQGYLMDTHTAVGYRVLQKYRQETGDGRPALLASTASPFKFSGAVLEALGCSESSGSEFRLLEKLSRISGQAVPARLAELRSRPEIHREVCAKEEMGEVLRRFLGNP